jgi:hypothetical protein
MKVRALLCLVGVAGFGALGGVAVSGASSTPIQYFTAVQTSADGSQTIVAAGVISATGTDQQLGAHRDNFVFPNGTITVRHEPQTQHQTFDSRTCVGTFTESGTYDVSHGTGDYTHATGSGVYNLTGVAQGCDRSAPPTSFVLTINAHGPLTL